MKFTEHELTAALTGVAKTVLARSKEVRKGRTDLDTAWDGMDRYQRFKVLDSLGDQILPVLAALPDIDVAPGTRPMFSDQQITETVEAKIGDEGGRLRRKVAVATRVALVRAALEHVPPRIDPDALTVPDHL